MQRTAENEISVRPLPLIVHVQRAIDATCVAEALAEWGTRVERTGSRWDINVESRSLAIGDVLSTLHKCLANNHIPLVRVTIEGRTYAMEQTPS
jgi:hypothetical protein